MGPTDHITSKYGIDDLCNAIDQFTNLIGGWLCCVTMAAAVAKIAEKLDMSGLGKLNNARSFQYVIEDVYRA